MKRLVFLAVIFCAPALSLAPVCSHAEQGGLKRFDLSVVEGAVSPEPRTLRVTQGDTVEIEWSTDREIHLHVHGYNIEVVVKPDAPAAMRFDADATGRFAVEEHGADRHHGIAYLEVHPR